MEFLSISLTEWVGYLAMATLLVSFMMKDVTKLRVINTIGCAFFVAYGLLLATAWPIVITNAAIICINLYYLLIKKN
ncbi:MAG: uroporphyrinogen decarboxylase [Oceanihabitans sp.]